jgi:tetratricopeptide (TPR) repeat protein
MDQLAETVGAPAAVGSSDARRRLWAVLGALPLLFALVLFEVLAFRGGGYIPTSAAPVVIAFCVVLAVWAASRPRPAGGRLVAAGLAALGAFAVWSGVSTLWSLGPDLSWISFNYAALFALVAASCVFARPGVWGLRLAGFGFLLAMLPVAVYAFLGKALPDVVTHAHLYARLAQPVGYWNVLAVLLVMATPVALAAAARPGLPPVLRAAAASALSLMLVTFFFTFSRGGIVAMCVALIAYFAATRTRLGSLLTLVIGGLPVALVLYHLRGLGTLYAATSNDALRTSQGHRLGVWTIAALAVAFVLQLGVCLLLARWRPQPKLVRVFGWAVLAAVLVLVIGGPLVYMSVRGGIGPWISNHYHAFISSSSSEQGDTATRLTVVSSNGRIQLYQEALRGVSPHLVAGTGAGTFTFTNYRYRDVSWVVKHAHSQWVNVLSELGIVGLLLFATAILGLFAAAGRSLWRRRAHAERSLLAACFAAALAFAVHMSVDWDWDMAAATTAFLLLLTVVAAFSPAEAVVSTDTAAEDVDPAADGYGAAGADVDPRAGSDVPAVASAQAPRPRRLPIPAVVLACGLPLLMAVSWMFPYLSARAEAQAISQADQHPGAAAASARRAHSLDPLTVDPLVTLSQIQQGEGRPAAALATLRRAARLQPDNYYVHYTIGVLLATALHRDAAAADQFRRALALNPLDALSQYALGQVAQR